MHTVFVQFVNLYLFQDIVFPLIYSESVDEMRFTDPSEYMRWACGCVLILILVLIHNLNPHPHYHPHPHRYLFLVPQSSILFLRWGSRTWPDQCWIEIMVPLDEQWWPQELVQPCLCTMFLSTYSDVALLFVWTLIKLAHGLLIMNLTETWLNTLLIGLEKYMVKMEHTTYGTNIIQEDSRENMVKAMYTLKGKDIDQGRICWRGRIQSRVRIGSRVGVGVVC